MYTVDKSEAAHLKKQQGFDALNASTNRKSGIIGMDEDVAEGDMFDKPIVKQKTKTCLRGGTNLTEIQGARTMYIASATTIDDDDEEESDESDIESKPKSSKGVAGGSRKSKKAITNNNELSKMLSKFTDTFEAISNRQPASTVLAPSDAAAHQNRMEILNMELQILERKESKAKLEKSNGL